MPFISLTAPGEKESKVLFCKVSLKGEGEEARKEDIRKGRVLPSASSLSCVPREKSDATQVGGRETEFGIQNKWHDAGIDLGKGNPETWVKWGEKAKSKKYSTAS